MIVLPFPASSLSGHSAGHWRTKAAATAKHRAWAKAATMAVRPLVADVGDIPVHIRFVPANHRGDRANFPNRMKPYLDGIAEALGVNDSRFLPSYTFSDPESPGRVEVTVGAAA